MSKPVVKTVQIDGQNYNAIADQSDSEKELRPYPTIWPRWSVLDDNGKGQYLVVATRKIEEYTFQEDKD